MEKLTVYFNIEPNISDEMWATMNDIEREQAFRQGKTTHSQTKSVLEKNNSDELRQLRDEFMQGLIKQMNEFVRDYDAGKIPVSALGIEKKQSLLKGLEENDYIPVYSECIKYYKTLVRIRLDIYKFAKELDSDLVDFECAPSDFFNELKKRSQIVRRIVEKTEINLSDEEVLIVAVRDALRDEIRHRKHIIPTKQIESKLP
jgi:hypothetical protein